MPKEYITEQELQNLMEDLVYKLENEDTGQITAYLNQLITDSRTKERYIDRTYLTRLKNKKRETKIAEITSLLRDMDNDQIENVRVYAVDEYDEPNHEAAALDAIIKLSKGQKKEIPASQREQLGQDRQSGQSNRAEQSKVTRQRERVD